MGEPAGRGGKEGSGQETRGERQQLPPQRNLFRVTCFHASNGPFQKLPGAHLTFPRDSVYHPRLRQGSELQAYRFSHCTASPPGTGWTCRSFPALGGPRGAGTAEPASGIPACGWTGAGGRKQPSRKPGAPAPGLPCLSGLGPRGAQAEETLS